MSNTKSVIIDGVRYVPALSVEAPVLDDVMQALYDGYMGPGVNWKDSSATPLLRILITEEDEGEEFWSFYARVLAAASVVPEKAAE